jgi:hypothetical protein
VTTQAPEPRPPASHAEHKRSMLRRGFLGSLGAGSLATAATLFGRATPAEALVTAGCCNLCHNPGNFSTCDTGTHYLWECAYDSDFLFCYCCEHGTTADTCSGVTASAYTCHYG